MGCEPFETEAGTVIVCSRGTARPKPCQEPGCGRPHAFLCDYPVVRGKQITTCDRRMCKGHAQRVGDDDDDTVDYCPAHARLNDTRAAMARTRSPDEPPSNSPADVGFEGSAPKGDERPRVDAFVGPELADVAEAQHTLQRCGSCRRKIVFLPMHGGASMPVNADPVRVVVRRTVATQGDLFGEASSGAPEVAGVVETAWIPHWQTCTDPKRWRTKNTPT